MNKVSVVIPSYNAERWVEEALQSCLDQTYPLSEIIIVDDGSTDNTVKVITEIQTRYPEKINLLTGPNQGAPAARNKGLNVATGDYIQFLDADDVLLPNKIESQIELISQRKIPPDLVVGDYVLVRQDGTREKITAYVKNPWSGLIQSRLGSTCSNLWKTSVLKQVGQWNENFKSSQEYELMFRLLKTTDNILYDPEPLTIVFNRHSGSISKTNLHDNMKRFFVLRCDMGLYLKERELLNEEISLIIFRYLSKLYEYDREQAMKYHQQLFPRKLSSLSLLGYTKLDNFVYQCLGFTAYQRFRSLINVMRPGSRIRSFKSLLKKT